MIRQNYGFECDLWSAGALIYQLLCGKVPFPPDSSLSGRDLVFDLFKRILNSPIDLTSEPGPFKTLSPLFFVPNFLPCHFPSSLGLLPCSPC